MKFFTEDVRGELNSLIVIEAKGAKEALALSYTTNGEAALLQCRKDDASTFKSAQILIDLAKADIKPNFKKFDDGKTRYDLVPTKTLNLLAEILTFGAEKYGANNWKECEDTSRYVGAAMRHFEAFRAGEINDPESGLPHLAHCLTNITFLIELQKES